MFLFYFPDMQAHYKTHSIMGKQGFMEKKIGGGLAAKHKD